MLTSIFGFTNLLMMFIGVTAGIIIGAMPGLSIIMAIVLLLPMTYGMDSITGMYLLLGAYCGGTFGGSISAILINTPGTGVAAATILDGYPMAQKGKGADALKIALVGSTVGGIVSSLALLFFAPLIATAAFAFGPAEFFSLSLFGITMVANVSGGSLTKGIISASIGLVLAIVGIDPIEGSTRMTFGIYNLMSGLNLVAIMLGVFALSEMLSNVKNTHEEYVGLSVGKATISYLDIFKRWKVMITSSLIGLYVGALPGTGGSIGAFMAYDVAKKMSREPEEFGKGSVEGLLAPEAGNNATTGAALIPMLTLGIPGSAAVAVLMGALTAQNIIPGPDLFTKDSFWVYSVMVGLIIINIIMFIQGTVLSKIFAKVANISHKVLIPVVLMLCVVGCFSIQNSYFDVQFLIFSTALGCGLKYLNMPLAPLTIGMVLGGLIETNLRRALILSDGDIMIFVERPISFGIIMIALISVVYPYLKQYIIKKKAGSNA